MFSVILSKIEQSSAVMPEHKSLNSTPINVSQIFRFILQIQDEMTDAVFPAYISFILASFCI